MGGGGLPRSLTWLFPLPRLPGWQVYEDAESYHLYTRLAEGSPASLSVQVGPDARPLLPGGALRLRSADTWLINKRQIPDACPGGSAPLRRAGLRLGPSGPLGRLPVGGGGQSLAGTRQDGHGHRAARPHPGRGGAGGLHSPGPAVRAGAQAGGGIGFAACMDSLAVPVPVSLIVRGLCENPALLSPVFCAVTPHIRGNVLLNIYTGGQSLVNT